ncbi:MAG: energy-coupling factor transporter transmembrane protein EcfT [Planctomycetes bacterium]|nr:energy-coupling factor transporter transmembrane protein EcfT [Planctomycetota bacterium]
MIAEDIDRMDALAAGGRSILHRASPAARVASAGIVVVSAALAGRPLPLAAGAGILLLLAAVAGAEPGRVLLRSLAPLPFLGALFLLHPETPLERMGLLLLRAGVSCMALVLLLSTTTFADVLRVLGVFLPRTLTAALAVLYRSLFILLRASTHMMEAARLRGARGGAGTMVGGLLLHAFERTENVACVMHVRGVDVPDPDRADALRPRAADLLPLGAAAAVAALSLASLRP